MNLVIEVEQPIAVYRLVNGKFICSHDAVKITKDKTVSPSMPPLYIIQCANPECPGFNKLVNDCL